MMVVDGKPGCYVWPENRVLIRRSEHPRFVRPSRPLSSSRCMRNKLGLGSAPCGTKPGSSRSRSSASGERPRRGRR